MTKMSAKGRREIEFQEQKKAEIQEIRRNIRLESSSLSDKELDERINEVTYVLEEYKDVKFDRKARKDDKCEGLRRNPYAMKNLMVNIK